MKNILRIGFVALAISFCGVAEAQQLSNSTFDNTWVTCKPWYAGKYYSSGVGNQPEGWCISNVCGVNGTGATTVGSEGTGSSGTGKSVILTNTANPYSSSEIVPGYISLGTTWATAETQMFNVRNADGGVFGGIEFSYHPDAIQLNYQHSISSAENMSIIAYLWKGTWSQADVPSETAMGVFSYGSATKVTMIDRANNVLGEDCLTGGTISYAEDNKNYVTQTDDNKQTLLSKSLIASVQKYIADATSGWTSITVELDYGDYTNEDVDVEKLNIIFSASDFFGSRSNIVKNNSISIDDVTLLYYHALSTLSYEGATIDFSETTTSYDLSSYLYDESKLSYTKKGQGASITKSYNIETGILTIRVQGEDYNASSNADAYTEYTIQFKPCSASMFISSSAQYSTFVAPFDVIVPSGVTAYTVSGYEGGSATLNMTEVSGTISANTPVILYSESGLNETNVYGINSATGTSVTSGLLTGVYSDYQTTGGEYVLQNHEGKVAFYKVDASVARPWVRANHCYIPASASSAKMLNLNNDATAISTLSALTSGEYESIYSASGAKQNSLQKGVNILKMNDGTTRKVLVK